MAIVVQTIPQWQSGQQNLNVVEAPTPDRPADAISQEMIERVKVLENVVSLMEVFTL